MTRDSRSAPAALLLALLLALPLAACADDAGTADRGDEAATDPAADAPDEGAAGDDAPRASDAVATPDTGGPADDGAAGAPAPSGDDFAGVLGGSDIEGGCVWLDADDGTRYELVTPTTSEVRIDPANQLLVSATGDVIAESGDRVVIEGVLDEGLMTFCQVGVILAVQDATPE